MPLVIGLTGPSGSGKSTLAAGLVQHLGRSVVGSNAVLITLDAYYRDLSHLTLEARDQVNFDHPDAIEAELAERHLAQLRAGETVIVPEYDFSTHNRAEGGTSVSGSVDVIVLEGLLLAAFPELRAQLDALIYVDLQSDVCLKRRVERDVRERGRTRASVQAFWSERVLPMFEEFVAPAKAEATLVVAGDADQSSALAEIDALLTRLQTRSR